MKLEGKCALITGGGKGLGRAIADAFAAEGAKVTVASRTLETLEQVAADLRKQGCEAFAVEADVSQPASVAKMVETARSAMGRIDVLVNSAGVGWAERVVETSDGTWDWIIQTNLNGTFYCCRDVGRVMIEQKAGSIINIASVAGVKGPIGLGAYAASKGGVMGLTRVMALEVARYGVRVNALCPGYFRTEMNEAALDDPEVGPKIVKRIPMRRAGRPEEIGPIAVLLASDDGTYITGETYFISGGEMAQ